MKIKFYRAMDLRSDYKVRMRVELIKQLMSFS
jgi:hypothetical protein